MKRLTLVSLSIALCACSSLSTQSAGPVAPSIRVAWQELPTTTNDLKVVESFAKQLPRDRTLVVFDIDDTLLTTESIGEKQYSFYGSDRWFVWQEKENPGDAKVGGCLIDLITLNYSVMPMQTTQADAPEVVARIPNDKLVITSRGPANWESTLRELTRAGFKPLSPTVRSEPADFMGSDEKRTDKVSYRDGIMLTSGLNKGAMLKEMLRLSNKMYDHVILVDDTQKHLDRMRAAIEPDGIKFYGTRYTRIKDGENLPIVTDDQIKSHERAYAAMLSLLPEVSPETAARFKKKGCGNEAKTLHMLSL